jgi:aryl-alcohol dehydrogenase-like predicted oxidoreductase
MALGFGAYRVSIQSAAHKKALMKALDQHIALIDTSTNYTNGDSETLVGECLSQHVHRPIIVSKVGYVQGPNLKYMQELNNEGRALSNLVKLSEHLWHSLHPDYIRQQLELSLKRLKLNCIDYYLLHNPEYFFHLQGANQENYYRQLEISLSCLEELAQLGLIKHYGISSNTFVVKNSEANYTNLLKVLDIVETRQLKHFKMIQFPMNLIERGALTPIYQGKNLIEVAKDHDLLTLANRPLNAFENNQLIRLAIYPQVELSRQPFKQAISQLRKVWAQQESDELEEVPLIKQILEIWDKQKSIDAIEQIFYAHLFPFITQVYGRDLNPDESSVFFDWFDLACSYARLNMTNTALDLEKSLYERGTLTIKEFPQLQLNAIKQYQQWGVDFVLVGMKNEQYVEELKCLF